MGIKTWVVNDIIGQIKKFKPITSNKSFLDFIEKLEIKQQDWESFEKMADSLAISKIDTKLPDNVSEYWDKIVIKKTLEDLSSMLKEEWRILFPTTEIDQVKLLMTLN